MYAASGRAAAFVRRVLAGAASGGDLGRRGGGRGGSKQWKHIVDAKLAATWSEHQSMEPKAVVERLKEIRPDPWRFGLERAGLGPTS